jgi:hypothetical protein
MSAVTSEQSRPAIYGLIGEFQSAEELVTAARSAQEKGYTRYDAYAPFPVEDLDDVVPNRGPSLPLLVLIGGLSGAAFGYGLQYYISVWYYPINVGGRPLHSWPSFIPVAFEVGILVAALTAVFGMLALNRLPMPYHPVFNVPRFAMASNDRFFLSIEARDPQFDQPDAEAFLEKVGARDITVVPH